MADWGWEGNGCMNESARRVVVTGTGLITPLGSDEETVWTAMMQKRCGIRRLTLVNPSDYKTPIGGEVETDAINAILRQVGVEPVGDRTVDMALAAAGAALRAAGLSESSKVMAPPPIPVIFGTGIGASHSLYHAFESFFQKGVRGLRPTSVPRCMANAISAQISITFRLTGANYVIVSACTSSTTAAGVAFRMIRDGYAECVLCGGADAVFDPFVYAGWNNLGVMSKNPDPLSACRPFDSRRDGCVLGEGAGALVIESLHHAMARGARIRGEILGYGESSDASHITSPSVEGQALAIRDAMSSAGIVPEQIGFINAHGTATRANDECESKSILAALGPAAASIPAASNKSFFGHLLGASGVVESIVTLIGLERGIMPPNLNLDDPDPSCNLCFVRGEATKVKSPVAMKNSFGFGGNNAVLILRAWEETSERQRHSY